MGAEESDGDDVGKVVKSDYEAKKSWCWYETLTDTRWEPLEGFEQRSKPHWLVF